MKTTFLLVSFLLLGLITFAQNQAWILAPKKFTMTSSPVSAPLPTMNDYTGDPAKYAQNIQVDANGNILFFIVDGIVYDKNGKGIGVIQGAGGYYVHGEAEIVIVPDPSNCSRYYIIGSGALANPGVSSRYPFYEIVDVSVTNSNGSQGVLVGGGVATNIKDMTPGYLTGNPTYDYKMGGICIAASKLRSDNSRFVFITNGKKVFRYKIDNTGFNYSGYFYLDPSNTAFNNLNIRSEMELIELSNGNYRIAVPFLNQVSDIRIAVFTGDLNTNGELISGTEKLLEYHFGPLTQQYQPYVHGLEFSPNGSILYITHDNTPQYPNPIEYYDFSNPTAGVQPLNVTNAIDFKSSQIELGLDGKLYFATSNRLATLSNPNTPNPTSNWTNNAVTLTNYQASFGAGLPTEYALKTYLLPDQIDGMNYTSHFFVNTQCCITNKYYDAINYTATTNATWQPGWLGSPFASISGEVYIKETLIIPAGKTITIKNMTFKFAPNAKVIVERGTTGGLAGGKLILDGTTFTADDDCTESAMWLGVQVYGYNNQNQLPASTSKQGWLTMINNSKIEHSIKGASATLFLPFVFLGQVTYISDPGYCGGVIQATNATFRNNIEDVNVLDYIAPSGAGNESYFTNCTFITDGLLNNTASSPLYHAYIKNVKGVKFYGCDFKNIQPGLYAYNKRGQGIYASNAHFTVEARCLSTLFPCSSFDYGTFQGLYYGINATSSDYTRTIKADRNNFVNNIYGVRLSGLKGATLTRNNFEVLRSAAPNPTLETYGLYLDNCDQYAVQENSFTEYNDPSVSAPGNTYGVIVNNSGEAHNEIYKNNFSNIKVGGQSQNINGTVYVPGNPNSPITGLQWKCNTFSGNIYQADLAVTSGRIDYQQGYLVSPVSDPVNAPKAPAGNRFSHSTFNATNDIFVNSSAQQFQYVHHADAVTTPLYYTPSLVSPVMNYNIFLPVYYNNTTSCPSKINDGGIVQLQAKSDSLLQVISEREKLIDGGNTSRLLSSVADKSSKEVKNDLLLASPYLSDEVLLAYLAKNPSPEDLKQVISMNAPLSSQVSDAVNQMNLPKSFKSITENTQGDLSAMTYLTNDLQFLKREKQELAHEQIRLLLFDEQAENPMEQISMIMKEEGITFTPVQEPQYIDLSEHPELQPSSHYIAGVFDRIPPAVVEPLEISHDNTETVPGRGDRAKTATDGLLHIYPNPSETGNNIVIELEEATLSASTSIEVIDLAGKSIVHDRFENKNGRIVLSPGTLIPGVYIVKLYDNSTLTETKKLLVK